MLSALKGSEEDFGGNWRLSSGTSKDHLVELLFWDPDSLATPRADHVSEAVN